MFKRLSAILLFTTIALICISTHTAFADVAPDTLKIKTAVVGQNMDEPGDMLFVFQYQIAWDDEADYPEDPAKENYLVQLLATDKSYTIGATTPYPYYNNGYDKGVASFYFDADEVDILGITWEEPYVVRVTSQPGYLDPVAKYDYVISDTDYCPSSDQVVNRIWVKDWIIDIAQSLETDWGVATALTAVQLDAVLSVDGEVYFLRVIPGLRYLCPNLFTLNLECPEPVTEGSRTGEQALLDRSEYADTWVGDFIDIFGGNATLVLNGFALGLILFLMAVSFGMFQVSRPGLLLGLYTLPIGAELRFTEPVVVAFIAFCYLLFAGYTIFAKQAG